MLPRNRSRNIMQQSLVKRCDELVREWGEGFDVAREEVKSLGRSMDVARSDGCSTTGKWHRFDVIVPISNELRRVNDCFHIGRCHVGQDLAGSERVATQRRGDSWAFLRWLPCCKAGVSWRCLNGRVDVANPGRLQRPASEPLRCDHYRLEYRLACIAVQSQITRRAAIVIRTRVRAVRHRARNDPTRPG
jgi:hypothetical protein